MKMMFLQVLVLTEHKKYQRVVTSLFFTPHLERIYWIAKIFHGGNGNSILSSPLLGTHTVACGAHTIIVMLQKGQMLTGENSARIQKFLTGAQASIGVAQNQKSTQIINTTSFQFIGHTTAGMVGI